MVYNWTDNIAVDRNAYDEEDSSNQKVLFYLPLTPCEKCSNSEECIDTRCKKFVNYTNGLGMRKKKIKKRRKRVVRNSVIKDTKL